MKITSMTNTNVKEMAIATACANLKGTMVKDQCQVDPTKIAGAVKLRCGIFGIEKLPLLTQGDSAYFGYSVPKASLKSWEKRNKKEISNIDITMKMSGKYAKELPAKSCKITIQLPLDQLESLDKIKKFYMPKELTS